MSLQGPVDRHWPTVQPGSDVFARFLRRHWPSVQPDSDVFARFLCRQSIISAVRSIIPTRHPIIPTRQSIISTVRFIISTVGFVKRTVCRNLGAFRVVWQIHNFSGKVHNFNGKAHNSSEATRNFSGKVCNSTEATHNSNEAAHISGEAAKFHSCGLVRTPAGEPIARQQIGTWCCAQQHGLRHIRRIERTRDCSFILFVVVIRCCHCLW